jgi:hypothetical protein
MRKDVIKIFLYNFYYIKLYKIAFHFVVNVKIWKNKCNYLSKIMFNTYTLFQYYNNN